MLSSVIRSSTRRHVHGMRRSALPSCYFASIRAFTTKNKAFRTNSLKDWAKTEETSNEAVIKTMVTKFETHAQKVVPWFHKMMPDLYFQSVPLADRLDHLRLLAAFQGHAKPPQVGAWSSDGAQLTIMLNNVGEELSRSKELLKLLQSDTVPAAVEIGADKENIYLSRVSRYMSKDESVTMILFQYGAGRVYNPNANTSARVSVNRENVLKYSKDLQNNICTFS